MNENKQTQTRVSKLEQLTPQQQSWILETALNSSLTDMTLALRAQGIDTSPASLCRFIRKDRERRLLEDRKDIGEAAAALAAGAGEGKLREGTLEAVRHRLYERALVSQSPQEAMELYAAMVKEEARLRELELEARKVAALEEQVKLQRLRVEVEMTKARQVKGVKSAEVVEGSAEINQGEPKVDGEGRSVAESAATKQLAAPSENEKRLALALREVNEIANRGGPLDEKWLEMRARLAEEMKVLGAVEDK